MSDWIPLTNNLVSGGVATASALVAVFFLRYWRDTADRLFLIFAIAFLIHAVNRVLLVYVQEDEMRTYLYWVRFAAYACILGAIIDKNRRSPAG
jgi:hypothetical protein